MADKFGNTDHYIELKDPCKCIGGTGHFLQLYPKSDKEAAVVGGWACGICFGLGGRSPFPVGSWVGKTTKKSWKQVKIKDLVAIKKVYIHTERPPMERPYKSIRSDNIDRDIKDFITGNK